MATKKDSKATETKVTGSDQPKEAKPRMVSAAKDRQTADRQSQEKFDQLPDDQKAAAEAYSQNVANGGQNPNVVLPASKSEGEKETMTSEELANSKQPLAPEKPLEAPQDDPVEAEYDDTDPAPQGASQPAEPLDK